LKRAFTGTLASGRSFRFFAAPGGQLADLRTERGCLRSSVVGDELDNSLKQTSDGDGIIRPGDFDRFLIYGVGFWAPLTENYHSQAVVEQRIVDIYESSINFNVAAQIRSITSAPIVVAHEPMPAWRRKNAVIEECYSYRELVPFMAKTLNKLGYQFLPQPSVTIEADGWATQDQYAAGGTGLGNAAKERVDKSHMNATYGRHVIEELFELIERPEANA
jgi:hypothetical protein